MWLKVCFAMLLLFGLNLSATPISVLLNDEEPDYSRLETVVRLKRAEGVDADYCLGHTGLEVVVETRDKVNKSNKAWYGMVTFRPSIGKASLSSSLKSRVDFKYAVHPKYFKKARTFGNLKDSKIFEETKRPLFIFNVPWNAVDVDGDPSNRYEGGIRSSFFEWQLPQTLSVKDLITALKNMKIDNGTEFPRYNLYGYSPDGGSLNCATFSLALLQQLGVTVCRDPYISKYISNYMGLTPWGRVTEGVRYLETAASGVGGAVGGVAAASFLAAKAGEGAAIGGLLGGPIGAVVGGAVGGGVGLVGGYFVVGKITKYVMEKPSEMAQAATAEAFMYSLFQTKHQHGAKVVAIDVRGKGKFLNEQLRNIINHKKGWFASKLDSFPDACVIKYEILN